EPSGSAQQRHARGATRDAPAPACASARPTARPCAPRRPRRLAGLAVRRVRSAPAAVLAQLDPLGIVALGLVALIVAPLALRARERDCNSYVGDHSSSLAQFGHAAMMRP